MNKHIKERMRSWKDRWTDGYGCSNQQMGMDTQMDRLANGQGR